MILESAAPTNLGSWGGAGDLWGLLTLCFFIHIRKRPSNFYWNCNSSLLLSLLTQFAFIFFAVWSVWLSCEQREKGDYKSPHFSLIFALSEFVRRT
jgi:hypothetical protein